MEAIVYPAATASAAAATVDAQSGVSWAAVAAGAVAAAALTLLLVAFGAGIGFSSISPWSDTGVSGSTFAVGTGIYLVIVAVMSSAVGGYLAGRLRTKWVGVHTSEVFFRDTAHGFLAWAFATLLSATILTASTAYVANGVAAGAGGAAAQAARSINPAEVYVDKLLRPAPGSMHSAPPRPRPRRSRMQPPPIRQPPRRAPGRRAALPIRTKREVKSCACGPPTSPRIRISTQATRLMWRKSWPRGPASARPTLRSASTRWSRKPRRRLTRHAGARPSFRSG